MKTFRTTIMALIATITLVTVQAQADRGLEIAQAADLADQGFQSSEANLTMILRNKQGQETTRELVNQTLELTDDGGQDQYCR